MAVRFFLSQAQAEFTGWLPNRQCGWLFKNGVAKVPDAEADGAESLLCRYHGATREEVGEMKVAIYGPSDKGWQDEARQLARQRYPENSLFLKGPTQFTPRDLDQCVGVFVVQGEEANIWKACEQMKVPCTVLAPPQKVEAEAVATVTPVAEELGVTPDEVKAALREAGEVTPPAAVVIADTQQPEGRPSVEGQMAKYVANMIKRPVREFLRQLKEDSTIGENQELLRALHVAECDNLALNGKEPRVSILGALESRMEGAS